MNRRILAKTMFDRVVSAIALIVLAPLMLAIAVWIKLASPGPILFRQVRIGKDARPFRLLKYRSMTPGADRLAGNVTPRDDPRVTRVGRALRRWYLDELPQLMNVLRGAAGGQTRTRGCLDPGVHARGGSTCRSRRSADVLPHNASARARPMRSRVPVASIAAHRHRGAHQASRRHPFATYKDDLA